MRILADTNLFVKFCRRLPLPPGVESHLEAPNTERCLASVSVLEIFRLWQAGRLPDHPDTWLHHALPSWRVLPMTAAIARQSVLWPWEHRDPADRILAATAQVEKVELWHTDTILKPLADFPQKYFKGVN